MLGFPLGILSAAGAGGVAVASDYELISTTVLAGTAVSVTFSSLGDYSATYKHLQVRVATTNDGANNAGMRINGDTGSNYAWHHLVGTGSAVASSAETSQTSMAFFYIGAVTVGVGVIDLLDAYSTTKNKTVRTLQGQAGASAGALRVALGSGLFMSTSAISSVTILANRGSATNFSAGSRFSIYGIKG